VFSFLRQLTTWHCSHLLLNAVLLRRLAIDISHPPGPQQQTRRIGMQRSIDGTDGRTPYRYTDPATYYQLVSKTYNVKRVYVINKQRCSNNKRINFFSNRIVNLWNNLPSSTTDITSFRKFNKSLNNDYFLLYWKLNFAQFVKCFFLCMIF